MRGFTSVFTREVKSYFSTPLAYLFLVVFLAAVGFLTFRQGFFEAEQASLAIFFQQMPRVFIFLVPAMAMRLWAEERRSNSIELLFTLPITTTQAVLGKFFAAWAMLLLALLLTFPMDLMVAHLGNPDWGQIAAGYFASALLLALYLGIGSFFSSLTRNQVIAFVLAVVVCGIFYGLGTPSALEWAARGLPRGAIDAMEALSVEMRFESIQRGVLEIRDILFFVILTAGWLWANIVVLEERRGA
jgi:ABC-2 type transport system permease protein